MKTIVLAHGIFGVGSELFPNLPLPFKPVFDYFNGVAAHLNTPEIKVIAPTTSPLGSIEDRGKELARQLENLPAGRIDIIAHSMGGLDARFMLHRYPDIAKRITSLTTIGTPHHGSAVADMVHSSADVLYKLAPALLLEQVAALADLTTEKAEEFNARTPDVDGVHYMNIAGAVPSDSQHLLLELAAWIGKLSGPNDGVVLETSARFKGHEYLGTWPVDHFGEIGWARWRRGVELDASAFYPDNHLQRYDELIAKIRSIPSN